MPNRSRLGNIRANSLKVIGTAEIAGAVTVNGAQTFSTATTVNGPLTVGSTSTFNGPPTFATASTFNGPVTFGSTTTHNGAATFASSTIFTGSVPNTFTAAGVTGEVRFGVGASASNIYIYVCHTTNTWARSAVFVSVTAFN